MARLVFVLVLAALLPLGFTASAALGGNHDETDASWEFSGENQPTYLALWEVGEDLTKTDCVGWPDVLYENYAILYPDFRPLMDDPALRKRWRNSLIMNEFERSDSLNACFYFSLWDVWHQATDQLDETETISCGVVAANLNSRNEFAAGIVDELLVYGLNGSTLSLIMILSTEFEAAGGVRLNPDVRYYAQLAYDDITPPDGRLREIAQRFLTPSAGDLLTPERRAFVENAFGRRDYRSVLDTTEPCQVMNS